MHCALPVYLDGGDADGLSAAATLAAVGDMKWRGLIGTVGGFGIPPPMGPPPLPLPLPSILPAAEVHAT